jgi:hypothetical protein
MRGAALVVQFPSLLILSTFVSHPPKLNITKRGVWSLRICSEKQCFQVTDRDRVAGMAGGYSFISKSMSLQFHMKIHGATECIAEGSFISPAFLPR